MMVAIASEAFFMSVDPILPYSLSLYFGYNEHDIGVFFFNLTGVTVLASVFILFIPQSANRLLLVVIGCFLSLVGAFLTGPSKLFGLPNEIGLITAGMIVSGLAKALMATH